MSRHMQYTMGPFPCLVLPLVTACVADRLLPSTDVLEERHCALPSRPGVAICNCPYYILWRRFAPDRGCIKDDHQKDYLQSSLVSHWLVSGLIVRTHSKVAVARIDNARCCLCNSLLLPSVLLCAYQLPAKARCRAAMPGNRQQILKPRISSFLLLSSFPPTSTSIN